MRVERSGQRNERPLLIVIGALTCRNGPGVSANANVSFHVCADQTTGTANKSGGALTSTCTADFHDITSGKSGSHSAVTGYGLVTDWGSPKAALGTTLGQSRPGCGLNLTKARARAIPFRFPPFPANVLHLGHGSLKSRNKR